MKCILRPRLSGLGFLIAVVGVSLVASNTRAINAENPYGPIVSRNVFGLKPPTVTAPPTVAPVAAAVTFKLLGISTILDRPQVLLKVITAARPPEVAKTQSYLWGEGQGEDDIEVVAIDAVLGTVTIKNRGETVPLTMKEDAEKPAVGAALPALGAPSPLSPQLPGQLPPPPAGAGVVAPTGGSGPRTIPTRSLRTSTTEGAGLGAAAAAPGGWGSANRATLPSAAQTPSPNDANTLPYDAQMALIEIQRERTKEAVQAGRLPPLPPISFPQK
jgi:hypothetical protein